MERASSAKEAVQLMGGLSEQYGFYGESNSFEGGSESLIVTDKEEAWVRTEDFFINVVCVIPTYI